MDDTVHIPYVVDRLDEIIDLYEAEDDSLSYDYCPSWHAVEELRRELIFNMGVNSLARHKDQDQKILDGSDVPPVIKLRGVPDDSSKTDQIIKLLKAAGSGDAKKINKEIAEKVGCSLQHIYYCKRMLRGGVPDDD